jgi:hypothetical protein
VHILVLLAGCGEWLAILEPGRGQHGRAAGKRRGLGVGAGHGGECGAAAGAVSCGDLRSRNGNAKSCTDGDRNGDRNGNHYADRHPSPDAPAGKHGDVHTGADVHVFTAATARSGRWAAAYRMV